MRFGAHLPVMDFGDNPFTLGSLVRYAETATQLGFDALSVNDHLVFSVPWLDGPTALAAVLAHSGDAQLVTTVVNPVVRGPVPLAKALAAIDRLSGGRLVVALGPGSAADDYDAVDLPFEERWPRFDEVVPTLRALLRRDAPPFTGRFYSSAGLDLRPSPTNPDGPPLWVGSWGSPAGLRRAARHADGWLASAYNTTPADFADGWRRLRELLDAQGRDADGFDTALATMWFHLSDDDAEVEHVLRTRLLPAVHRPEEVLRARLPFGSPTRCADLLSSFREAGVQRVFVWPVADEVDQLRRFADEVVPLVG
jgi:alkanesulfonate monooxygenase SsuD/methylene tetrahydromethanopterin reductase-like flavin-dependent oxidoreductase (luciferase family)